MKLLQTEKPINKNFVVAIGLKYRRFVIREVGTLVLKYLGDTRLMIVVIKVMHVVGKRDGVR
jgi:hypothetical protein